MVIVILLTHINALFYIYIYIKVHKISYIMTKFGQYNLESPKFHQNVRYMPKFH